MHGRGDWFGWMLAALTAGLAATALLQTHERATLLIGWAILALVFIERRQRKVLTAKTIRIVDSEGAIRALIGHVGDGIQIGVRSEPLNNLAVSPALLWNTVPSVSFNFRYEELAVGGRVIEQRPALGASGYGEGMYKAYAAVFDFVPRACDLQAELQAEPAI